MREETDGPDRREIPGMMKKLFVLILALMLLPGLVIAENGGWTCLSCGQRGNTGNYCVKCGVPFALHDMQRKGGFR